MKIHNTYNTLVLSNELKKKLNTLRQKDNFDTSKYIEDKCNLLNKYMNKCNLSACTVAISGGIDSSVVLYLVFKASKMENSPIKKIIPVSLPIEENTGLTGQKKALTLASVACANIGIEPVVIELSKVNKEYQNVIESALKITPDAWAQGQLGPYSRTPALCYINTLLTFSGFNAITVGTTNRSEFGYIGYVGKFSDEAVDVQLISDIYKDQVIQVAKALNVPKEIIDRAPTGDIFDSRIDEEVFGAPYDFVELYCRFLNMENKDKFKNSLSKNAKKEFELFAKNLEEMHKYNKHKYISKSPAIHLDLFDASVKGGLDNYYKYTKEFLNF